MRTPTSITDQGPDARSAGYTLVELLAVLAILAIAASAVSFNGAKSLETAKFRALLVRTAAMISAGRSDAMRQMEERVFLVDIANRRMGYAGGGEIIRLPAGVGLTVSAAQSEQHEDGTLGIRFYPAGTSSGGRLAFTYRQQVYEVRVNWLTGNVSLHRI